MDTLSGRDRSTRVRPRLVYNNHGEKTHIKCISYPKKYALHVESMSYTLQHGWVAPTSSREDLYAYSSSKHWGWGAMIVQLGYRTTSNHWRPETGTRRLISNPTTHCRSVPRTPSKRYRAALQFNPCVDCSNITVEVNHRYAEDLHLRRSVPHPETDLHQSDSAARLNSPWPGTLTTKRNNVEHERASDQLGLRKPVTKNQNLAQNATRIKVASVPLPSWN